MLVINQILQNRYRIVRQLGQGGMGAVYEAIDERFGEPIALKEITIELANDYQKDSVMKAFEREAKSLGKAKHEVVPFVRDYFFESDRQFLVMELVEGDDLDQMLRKRGNPFPIEDVLNWMDQLLDALDYLHNLKPPIIHRDIKPQNLKLNNRGKIKLLDFGIARSSDKTSTLTNHTFVGATLNYSPIEQILRVNGGMSIEFILKHREKAEKILSQDTDARCDIYALGGTFYHLLTNQSPFDANTRILELWEGRPDPLINPSRINSNIPSLFSECLLKAMAVDQDNRYGSAIEMHKALKVAVSDFKRKELEFDNQKTKDFQTSENLAPTQQIINPNFNTLPSFVTDSQKPSPSFINQSETQSSGNLSNSEFTAPPYLEAGFISQKQTSPEKPILLAKTEERIITKNNKKLFWLIPTMVIGLFAVGGLGVLAIWSGIFSSSTVANKTNANISVTSTESNLNKNINSVNANISASSVNSNVVNNSPSTIVKSTPKDTKPVALETTPSETPKIRETVSPSDKPKRIVTTSNSSPVQKKDTSDNCVYNGICKN